MHTVTSPLVVFIVFILSRADERVVELNEEVQEWRKFVTDACRMVMSHKNAMTVSTANWKYQGEGWVGICFRVKSVLHARRISY